MKATERHPTSVKASKRTYAPLNPAKNPLPPVEGALETLPCENEGELQARGEADLKDPPLVAGGLKLLPPEAGGGLNSSFGWLILSPLSVLWFGRISPCGRLGKVDGALFLIRGVMERLAAGIRLWLNWTMVRALDWTLGGLKTCGEVA